MATDNSPSDRIIKAIGKDVQMANETTTITNLEIEVGTITQLEGVLRKQTRKTSGTTQVTLRCKMNKFSSNRTTKIDSLASLIISKISSRREESKTKARTNSINNSSSTSAIMARTMMIGIIFSSSLKVVKLLKLSLLSRQARTR